MRYLKKYKIFESTHEETMNSYYGVEVIQECDSIIADIKDMLLELRDVGLFISVGYTPMTLVYIERTPRIIAEVQGDSLRCSYNEYDIDSSFKRIEEYTASMGYHSESDTYIREGEGGKKISIYQIFIQK